MSGKMSFLVVTTIVFSSHLFLCVPGGLAISLGELPPYECNVTNTSPPCNVPYKSSMLILYCPDVVKWTRKLPNNDIVPPCNEYGNRTCIVKGYERLSNADSGPYYCEKTATISLEVMVNILAPPKLTNILNFPGQCYPEVERNMCNTTNVSFRADVRILFQVFVTFDGIGPFMVRWFLNKTEIHCDGKVSSFCSKNETSSDLKSSTLYISAPADQNVQGFYMANVSNLYGTNSSSVFAQVDCNIPPHSIIRYSVPNEYRNGTEGEQLDMITCVLGAPENIMQYVCFSPNTSVTSENVNLSLCALCYGNDLDAEECTYQFGNNDDLVVSSQKNNCPLKILIRIHTKKNSSLSKNDSGRIFCKVNDGTALINYTTLHLNVLKATNPTPDLFVVEVSVPASVTLLVIIVLFVAIAVLVYKYRNKDTTPVRIKRRKQREKQRPVYITDSENENLIPPPRVSGKNVPSKRGYNTINVTNHSDTECQSEWPGPDLGTNGNTFQT